MKKLILTLLFFICLPCMQMVAQNVYISCDSMGDDHIGYVHQQYKFKLNTPDYNKIENLKWYLMVPVIEGGYRCVYKSEQCSPEFETPALPREVDYLIDPENYVNAFVKVTYTCDNVDYTAKFDMILKTLPELISYRIENFISLYPENDLFSCDVVLEVRNTIGATVMLDPTLFLTSPVSGNEHRVKTYAESEDESVISVQLHSSYGSSEKWYITIPPVNPDEIAQPLSKTMEIQAMSDSYRIVCKNKSDSEWNLAETPQQFYLEYSGLGYFTISSWALFVQTENSSYECVQTAGNTSIFNVDPIYDNGYLVDEEGFLNCYVIADYLANGSTGSCRYDFKLDTKVKMTDHSHRLQHQSWSENGYRVMVDTEFKGVSHVYMECYKNGELYDVRTFVPYNNKDEYVIKENEQDNEYRIVYRMSNSYGSDTATVYIPFHVVYQSLECEKLGDAREAYACQDYDFTLKIDAEREISGVEWRYYVLNPEGVFRCVKSQSDDTSLIFNTGTVNAADTQFSSGILPAFVEVCFNADGNDYMNRYEMALKTSHETTGTISDSEVMPEYPVNDEYYTLSGKRINAKTVPGVYIRKITMSDGSVQTEKIVR